MRTGSCVVSVWLFWRGIELIGDVFDGGGEVRERQRK
jgi:hypothetical protein